MPARTSSSHHPLATCIEFCSNGTCSHAVAMQRQPGNAAHHTLEKISGQGAASSRPQMVEERVKFEGWLWYTTYSGEQRRWVAFYPSVAGEARAAARRAVAFPVRRALRWLLRRLRRISWIGVHRLTRECATALTAVDGHNGLVTQAVRSAVAELMRGDRLRIHGAGRRQAVCLARRDAGQAPCVSYRGGRRRARTRTSLGEGNEAERVTRRRLE